MNTPAFLDLLLPQLQSPMFTVAIDKWGTGTWDFGHINATKFTGSLQSVPIDDSCNSGGSWKVANIAAEFPEGTIPQANCGMFGESLLPGSSSLDPSRSKLAALLLNNLSCRHRLRSHEP